MKKEAEKAAKAAKFAEKQAKLKQQQAAKGDVTPKKAKKEKVVEEVKEWVEETPKGEKKSTSHAFDPRPNAERVLTNTPPVLKPFEDPQVKNYNPAAVESAWYDWWENEGFFKPELTEDGKNKPEGVFVIPAPPPNVTGALHIGHALTIAIQDTLIRW